MNNKNNNISFLYDDNAASDVTIYDRISILDSLIVLRNELIPLSFTTHKNLKKNKGCPAEAGKKSIYTLKGKTLKHKEKRKKL